MHEGGEAGDLPPRPECAPQWRTALLSELVAVRLTLVIGQYALRWHLPDAASYVTEALTPSCSALGLAL